MVPVSMAGMGEKLEKCSCNVERYSFCHVRRPAGRRDTVTNTSHHIDLHATHMDQNVYKADLSRSEHDDDIRHMRKLIRNHLAFTS